MEIQMVDEVVCICCGNRSWVLEHELPPFLFNRRASIYRCIVCGCGCTYPQPPIALSFYEENTQYDALFAGKESLYVEFARQLIRFVGCGKANEKSLLDVGCGGGFLVQAAIDSGYQAVGLEVNTKMVTWASGKGLPVIQGDVEALVKNSDRLYDVIVLSAILEHLEKPIELLSNCQKILAPDGVIVVSQASYDGLLPKILPWGWYGWQPEQHYWHFTPSSFLEMAGSVGLKAEKMERSSLYHPWFVQGDTKTIIGRNLATLIARIGNAFHKGDSFNVVLRSA